MTSAVRGSIVAKRQLRLAGNRFISGKEPGILSVAGAPAAREIHIREKATHALVERLVSNTDGTWRVENLTPTTQFYVIAFDYKLQFNAVIRDNITPATT